MRYQILTVGNPNSGKTTLFNGLTGSKQQVGNWAGVTVEKKTGRYTHSGDEFILTDLPGIYALDSGNDSNSIDESIASRAVLTHPADLIINVVDVTCLERSLYMTLQLRELGRPMIVVLNKMDALKRERQSLDIQQLEKVLGCPVFMLSATSKEQVSRFKEKLHKVLLQGVALKELLLDYGSAFEQSIGKLATIFQHKQVAPRALAIRALENDLLVINGLPEVQRELIQKEQLQSGLDIDLHVADTKYTFLHEQCQQIRKTEGKLSHSFTQKADKLILNKWVGVPFFFVVMYLMFMFSINIGSAFIDFFDIGVGALLVDGGHHLLDDHLPIWLVTLLADGLGGGIQTVATFIPVIACLYLFLAVLESSGYMSRAAFVLDKVMQKIGLPGKAFVPLVLGFGCNVPAIMATRTLDQERERKLAASMAPFMSCGARLPVYALFAAAFFPESGQNVVFALYLLGILAAVFTGLVLKHTLYPGSSDSLVMEMPDYEIPTVQNVMIKTWQKLKRFVLGAGKTIVIVVMILSFLNSVGTDGSFGNEDSDNSVLSKVAQVVTPVFAPIGINQDNWPATVGIITGIFAKEAVVGTLNNLYTSAEGDESEYDLMASLQEAVMSIPENLTGLSFSDPLGIEVGDLTDSSAVAEEQAVDASIFGNLKQHFVTGHAAFAYLIFILLYTPCVAAMGAYVREFGANYARFIAVWTMGLAYGGAALYYQATRITETPVESLTWIIAIVMASLLTFKMLKRKGLQQKTVLEVQVA
ncbi:MULTISPECIES: Fe(2+) transporter permease subunit FeoB [unclassified Vibrio]|uniref:Fe(2+) transporter permease subunit FeoB n=1 Tax=unclassified Vibrio TaxID=2614977 RepID=UPI000B8E9D38|nr:MULTISPECIES: Fe(2+) transporter permease subunit FeoB [unclassified Vibrio]NAX43272.1 Fe(2+) transporter permease subunit FeoB [Vibrio sp. V25_P4S6T154]NNN76577.1 Fe(2+) transporter permease subunit FeoB [Vibrio sp. B7]NNN93162.1 Fe(2+) transporter permease subunit FeoB [Vibrio sp. B8-1]NNO08667.1 Fe(2+) transporter permease subunit FeoB [Vibrio sp. B4-12]MDQ2191694.1 Fe(2+) transporter permease subunit FeoB [Vibrio sp. A14(2019)]